MRTSRPKFRLLCGLLATPRVQRLWDLKDVVNLHALASFMPYTDANVEHVQVLARMYSSLASPHALSRCSVSILVSMVGA